MSLTLKAGFVSLVVVVAFGLTQPGPLTDNNMLWCCAPNKTSKCSICKVKTPIKAFYRHAFVEARWHVTHKVTCRILINALWTIFMIFLLEIQMYPITLNTILLYTSSDFLLKKKRENLILHNLPIIWGQRNKTNLRWDIAGAANLTRLCKWRRLPVPGEAMWNISLWTCYVLIRIMGCLSVCRRWWCCFKHRDY